MLAQSLNPHKGAMGFGFGALLTSIITFSFGLALLFFACMHYRFIKENVTTLESNTSSTRTQVSHSFLCIPWLKQMCLRLLHGILFCSSRSFFQGERAPYDLGPERNWEIVFGRNKWLWFLPIQVFQSRLMPLSFVSVCLFSETDSRHSIRLPSSSSSSRSCSCCCSVTCPAIQYFN